MTGRRPGLPKKKIDRSGSGLAKPSSANPILIPTCTCFNK